MGWMSFNGTVPKPKITKPLPVCPNPMIRAIATMTTAAIQTTAMGTDTRAADLN